MQETSLPRSNRERTDATRHALLDAARALFVAHGYGDTATPALVAAAGITRGALYHHFADKRDLFRQVLLRESQAVAADIRAAAPDALAPHDALLAGGDAYLAAMAVPGRTRLLLIEGPAVLGLGECLAMDESNAAATLREGLAEAGIASDDVPLQALAGLLSAAFNRAALEVDMGADAGEVRAAMRWLLQRTLGA